MLAGKLKFCNYLPDNTAIGISYIMCTSYVICTHISYINYLFKHLCLVKDSFIHVSQKMTIFHTFKACNLLYNQDPQDGFIILKNGMHLQVSSFYIHVKFVYIVSLLFFHTCEVFIAKNKNTKPEFFNDYFMEIISSYWRVGGIGQALKQ